MAAFELQDELQALQDMESYDIEHDHDFSNEDPEMLLEGRKNYHKTCTTVAYVLF